MNSMNKSKLHNIINKLSIDVSLKDIIDVTCFRAEAFNRDYNVFKVVTSTMSLVLKKTTWNEICIYNQLSKMDLDISPKIYCSDKINGDYWICMNYINAVSTHLNKSKAVDLVKKLAHLHCSYTLLMKKGTEDITTLSDDHLSKLPDYLLDAKFHEDEFNVILLAIGNLISCTHTLIHGDMIPLNVICTKDSVKIIDWEHGKIAPYTMDLGRLLGDYNINKPWIDPKWEQDLLITYKEECLTIMNASIDLNNFYRDYYSAKLINYVKVIATYSRNNLDEDEWYQVNRKQLYSLIKIVRQLH